MKTKTAVLNGKPDAGNPHVRFDEGEVASAKPRRGSLLYKKLMTMAVAVVTGFCLFAEDVAATVVDENDVPIDGSPFSSFADALSGAVDFGAPCTLKLYADVDADSEMLFDGCITFFGEMTLDLAGKTISGSGNTFADKLAVIENSGKLTIIDSVGGGKVHPVVELTGSVLNGDEGDLTIKGGQFDGAVVQAAETTGMITVAGGAYDKASNSDPETDKFALPVAKGYEVVTGEQSLSSYWVVQKASEAQVISKDGSTTTDYTDIRAAFEAAQAGDTVRLLGDVAVTGITLENKDVIFDLGGHVVSNAYGDVKIDSELTSPAVFDIKDTTFVVTNGVIEAVRGTAIRGIGGGNHIVIAIETTIRGSGPWMFFPGASTVDIYGSIAAVSSEYACAWLTANGEVVNVYDGAVLTSEIGDIFRIEQHLDEVPANPPTLNVYGGIIHAGGGYPIVHAIPPLTGKVCSAIVNVYGGLFTVDNLVAGPEPWKDWANAVLKKLSAIVYRPLDSECKAKFKPNVGLEELCAPGFHMVQGDDGYYFVDQTSFDVLIDTPEHGTIETSCTNDVPVGTEVTVWAEAAQGYYTEAITTNGVIIGGSDFIMPHENVTVSAIFKPNGSGSSWPEAWPGDADEKVVAKFESWSADNPGVDYSLEAVQNAFLMNLPVGVAIPELKIESVSVADDAATLVVSAEGMDLGDINGILGVEGTDELKNWTTTVVVLDKKIEGGKATFEVEGAAFMKASIGFKAPESTGK